MRLEVRMVAWCPPSSTSCMYLDKLFTSSHLLSIEIHSLNLILKITTVFKKFLASTRPSSTASCHLPFLQLVCPVHQSTQKKTMEPGLSGTLPMSRVLNSEHVQVQSPGRRCLLFFYSQQSKNLYVTPSPHLPPLPKHMAGTHVLGPSSTASQSHY